MQEYRAFILWPDGRVQGSVDLLCENEGEAIKAAIRADMDGALCDDRSGGMADISAGQLNCFADAAVVSANGLKLHMVAGLFHAKHGARPRNYPDYARCDRCFHLVAMARKPGCSRFVRAVRGVGRLRFTPKFFPLSA
jgi:hypothetical protein